MKKLSETLTELGIAFSFPIIIKDAKGNETYYENSRGFWVKRECDANGNDYWSKRGRDANGNETYYENSDGLGQVGA